MKLRVFKCDMCGAETEKLEEPKNTQLDIASDTSAMVYPYKKGWVYVYGMDMKFSPKTKISMKDKHFCNVLCLKKFFLTALKMAETSAFTERL